MLRRSLKGMHHCGTQSYLTQCSQVPLFKFEVKASAGTIDPVARVLSPTSYEGMTMGMLPRLVLAHTDVTPTLSGGVG
jgi:hypothetical protein